MKISTLFVEIDTLLDTRMATINTMGVDALKAVLDSGYHDRPFDIFPGIDDDIFKQTYAKRDKTTLAQAMVTPVSQIVKEFVVSTLDNINNSPFHYKPEVMLNIHPYVLEEEEIDVIIRAVKSLTMGMCDIEVVDMSQEQITPLFVKVNLSVMIMYHYDMWLEVHSLSGDFKKHTAPDVTLMAPRIYFKKPKNQPDPDMDPFSAMEKLVSPLIHLVLLPVETFSMVLKPVKKKTP